MTTDYRDVTACILAFSQSISIFVFSFLHSSFCFFWFHAAD